jgi:hypothetical protein
MGTILSILTSGAFGSLFGSLFQWLNRREENQHAEKMAALANQQQLALADKAREGVVAAGEQAVAAIEAGAFSESQKSSFAPIGETIKSWVRAAVVGYLLLLATFLAAKVGRLVGGLESLDPGILIPMYSEIIAQVFFLTNLSISWYFGARGTAGSTARKAIK